MMETTREENMGSCSVVIYGPLVRTKKQAGVEIP